MATNFFQICAFLAILSTGFAATCSNPDVTSTSFTTQDATVITNIAYVTEFSATCRGEGFGSLYADIDEIVVPVSVVGQNKYQVSWTEEVKSAKSGERVIRLFDEDGYTNLKKALRNGEDTSAITPVFTVSVHHPGAFSGPWLKSELLAVAVSFVVAYLALSSKSKLLN